LPSPRETRVTTSALIELCQPDPFACERDDLHLTIQWNAATLHWTEGEVGGVTLREWINRLWATVCRHRDDVDLDDELRSHLELAAAEAHCAGHLRGSAARTAAIRAGGVAQALEALRDQRGLPWLDDLMRDVRHAFRLLRRNPVFTAVAVISLALGIGANSAIFSLADALILRPLPVSDPGAVVTISAETTDQSDAGGRMSYPNYRDLRDTSQSFDGLLAYQVSIVSVARSRHDVREVRIGMLVSDNFFSVLGVQPALGRSFTPEEGQVPGRDAVVVLSYDFWKNAMAGDRSLDLNQPVSNLQTVSSLYRQRTIDVPLIILQTVGAMGLLGLTLALIGLYGLVAYSVTRRRQEIGIRMAIGAGQSDVVRMILRQGLLLSMAGVCLGGVASVPVVHLLTSALVGIGTPSPATYFIVPLLLICLTMTASYFPARHASLVDPLVALRHD
jgi:hypothetical protein